MKDAIGCVKQAKRLCYTLASPLTLGITRPRISVSRAFSGLHQTSGKLETPHDRIQPAFFVTYETVVVPFGCQVIAQVPCEHCLVKNRSFGDRFVEGTSLDSDSATPCSWIFSIALQCKIKVQDFKSISVQFPFKDVSCLTHNTPAMLKEISTMHEEDAHNDNLMAIKTSNQIHTSAQLRAAENAAISHVLETGDLNNNANLPLDVRNDTPALPAPNGARETGTLLLTIFPPRALPLNITKIASVCRRILLITANSRSQKHLHVILREIGLQSNLARLA